MNTLTKPQPPPIVNGGPAVWPMVIADVRGRWPMKHPVVRRLVKDMEARDAFGREKYGTPLQRDNGRDALADAYQEALDLCVYLKQALPSDEWHLRALYEDALRLAKKLRARLFVRDGR